MKMYVVVRFQFEGFHHFPEAPNEVDFLRKPHRHIFHCEVKLPVTHNDRELEFIMAKQHLQRFVAEKYDFELSKRSCEMICEDLLTEITQKYGLRKDITISVFEDAENGGVLQT